LQRGLERALDGGPNGQQYQAWFEALRVHDGEIAEAVSVRGVDGATDDPRPGERSIGA
jgi:hypothetical protein